MLLQKNGLRNVNAIAHEGKVVLIATDDTGHLWYSVRQDGFEDSYLSADPATRTGWEAWAQLDLPDEDDDTSVTNAEAAANTREDTPGVYLIRSRYKSKDLGAVAPVQLISAQGYLYIFRQSTSKTLLCDRFVLDGGYNRLGRALEVRFKRSRQRLTPYKAPKASALTADSLDFRDTQGKAFFEPTTELCLVNGVTDGWFSVVRLSTGEHEQFRWHIFAYNNVSKKIDYVSLLASDEGLFELIDTTVFDPGASQDDAPLPRSIPGVLRRTLSVPAAVITGGPAATSYDLQQERVTNNVKQYVRAETRVMLVVPTDKGTAALSFGVATDGTLSEVSSAISTKTMRADEKDLLLPLDTLDQIRSFGAAAPPVTGTISGLRADPDGDVVVSGTNADRINDGDEVEIRNTRSYNGLYTVSAIDDSTFTVDAQDVTATLGAWERRDSEQQKLVFDGMISGYSRVDDGKLMVSADNHGLVAGDQVQIVGTSGYDGVYPVVPLNAERFVIQRRWAAGEAINVKIESRKRRGIILDGIDDFIDLPPEAFPAGGEITISVWARGGASLPKDATFLEALDDTSRRVAYICLPAAQGGIYFDAGNGAAGCERVGQVAAQPDDYKGGWVHWAFTKNTFTGVMKIYRQGVEWASGPGTRLLGQAKKLRVGGLISAANKQPYEGTLADLAIYSRALSEDEIRASMFTERSGHEPGLMGYWRLGAIVEGEARTVTDISPGGYDGTVLGGASVGGVTLQRKLKDGTTLAVKYTNAELVAVVQRATYVEEIDFRVKATGGVALTAAAINNADGSGKPVFKLSYWGKRSRSAEDVMPFAVAPVTDPFVSLGGGWFRARCRFTIPDGMALLRSFEIADVRGTWEEMDIRRQAIRLVSNSVTESSSVEAPALATLADTGAALVTKLAQIAADEAQEAQLFADKLATEAKIALLADIEFLKTERDALVRLVDSLNRDVAALDTKYQEELANPLNYRSRLIVMGTGDQYLHAEGGTNKIISYFVGHEFEFVRQGNFYLMKMGDRWMYRDGERMYAGGAQKPWIVTPSGGGFLIRDPTDGRYIHREGGTGNIILYFVGHVWAAQRTSDVSAVVDQAKRDLDARKLERDAAKARLDALNALLDPNASSRAALEQAARDLAASLVTVQARLTTANTAYLDGVKSLQKSALVMPDLIKDGRGLVTRGAMLGFVRPTTRVSLRDTCDGNVDLCYSDASSRIRVTRYDARSDSENASFEQWLTDAGRACLSQVRTGAAATLPTIVVMGDTWSVEMWVSTPLPPWDWAALVGAQDKKNTPLAVLNGVVLGTQCEGRFFSSGFRFDSVPNGWHHVAAVKQGNGKDATVTFYVDGQKVGAPTSLWYTSVLLDGLNDAVDLQPASVPQSPEITLAFWTRNNAQGAQPGVLFDAVDAQGRRVMRVSMPDAMGFIGFECGSDAAGADVLEWRARGAEYQSGWTHWAFTKNMATGIMRAYRNGKLWARDTGKTKPLTVPTKVVIGKSASAEQLFYSGDLAQVCLYNKELSASEIQNGLATKVSTEDARLVGYWRFEGAGDKAKAKDYSKTAKDGTLLGGPAVSEVVPPLQFAVASVSDVTHLDPPAPLPPIGRGAIQAMMFDTNDRRIELPGTVVPTTNAVSICFWARGGGSLPRNHSILEAVNASNQRVLSVHIGTSDNCLYFDCGFDGTGPDRVQKPITATDMKGSWTHWAFTKNAVTGDIKIYQNGVLFHASTGAKKPIPAATRVVFGRTANDGSQSYSGELMELSIWDKALTLAEVTAVKDRMLAGTEAGLMGYWAFNATNTMTDLSPAKRHGTYTSGYTAIVSAPMPQSNHMYFDGVDDHVVLPEMNVDYSQGITAEAWVWFDKYNNNARIIDLGAGQAVDNIVLYGNATSNTLRLTVFRGGSALNLDANSALETGKWLHFAFTIDATGSAKIYKNGAQVAAGPLQLPANVARRQCYLGRSNWASDAYFSGRMGEVRLWAKPRSAADIMLTMDKKLSGGESGLVGYWSSAQNNAPDATPAQRHGTYAGGAKLEAGFVPQLPPPAAPGAFTPPPPVTPPLKLSELRIWGAALDRDEIDVNSKVLLTGNEPGLLNYLPMNEPIGPDLIDVTGKGRKGVIGVATRFACAAPIGAIKGRCDGIVSAEYSAVTIEPATQKKTAIMRSFFGWATDNGVMVLPDKRIEELELIWVGNTQFNPTLLGYIEGAPPIPSENLTESLSYNAATSVELVTSQDVEYRWNRAEDIGMGLSLDAFIGYEDQIMTGVPLSGTSSKALDVRSGLRGNMSLKNTWQAESTVTASTSNRMTDRLELRGTPEIEPKFPHIGKRFVPKNVGYALVISGTADMFVSRLMGSRKVVGYQIVPIDGVPPDVNTITFLLNPAYVMAGSLDGLTGTSPTTERFHKHVPAMRAQYGSLYPASYMRIKEAYELKQRIENDDKQREAFFAQFNTTDLFGASMESQIDDAKPPGEVTAPTTSAGGSAASTSDQTAQQDEQGDAVKKRQEEINKRVGDPTKNAHAQASFKAWQKKMERLTVLAGKRNIVNTYVWDADGGLRTETQSFASTAEHTIGGSFSVEGGVGYEGAFGLMGAKVELTAMVNGSLTQTLTKSQTTTTGIELNVDLSGVESIGITNHDDIPILPGEKVDRYRFMTFYLEGSTQNFHDFWSYVVDPEWLRSNGEEARALRAAKGKANKTWRVLHRVTYVERPVLMGVGRDMRVEEASIGDVVRSYLEALSKVQASQQGQLNVIARDVAAIKARLDGGP